MLLERLLGNLSLGIEPFALCEVERGCRLALEGDEGATVHFVLRGSGHLRAGRRSVPMRPNTLVLVPEHRGHELVAEGGGGRPPPEPGGAGLAHLRSLGSSGTPDIVAACGRVRARFAGGPALFELLEEPIALDFSESPEMVRLFDEILAESGSAEPGSEAMLAALMSRCLVMVFRRLCGSEDCPLPWLNALEDERLAAALEQILEEPEADHSLESLAQIAHMSRTAFAARFKDAFGSPPMAFLREQRLRRAAILLGDRAVNVGSVAGRVGFASRAHFSTAFRKRFGASPGEYHRRAVESGSSERTAAIDTAPVELSDAG